MPFIEDSDDRWLLPLITTGRTVDICTEAGADAYLKQGTEVDGFQAISPDLNKADDIRKKRNKKKKFNAKDRHTLGRIYAKLQSLTHASHEVFQKHVPKQEIEAWLQHSQTVFLEMVEDPHWIRTGKMFQYDELLLGSCLNLFKHPVATVMVFKQDITVLENISSMLLSRKGDSNALPSADVAAAVIIMVGNIFCCCMIRFDSPWSPDKVFKKLEATGILEQYLRCLAIPQQTDATDGMKTLTLKYLVTCAKFVKDRFVEGTPCGDTLRTMLGRNDGHAAACPVALPYLQSLMQLSTSLQTTVYDPTCFYCHEQKSNVNLKRCGRCKKAAYCSEQCQRAHWKEHKKLCVSTSLQTTSLDPVAHRPAYCFCCHKQTTNGIPKVCSRCQTATYCSEKCQLANWKEHKIICKDSKTKQNVRNSNASLPMIRNYGHKYYVEIMVRLVEECDKVGHLCLGDMIMELDFNSDLNGNIPVLQDPPQFKICSNSKYIEVAMENVEMHGGVSGVDQLSSMLIQRGGGDLMCFAKAQLGMTCYIFQSIDPFTNEMMYTEELLHAFRSAWVDEDYSHLEVIYEREDRWKHYKAQLERLRSQRISAETRSTAAS